MRSLVAALALALLVPGAVRGQERATPKDAELMVHRAVALLNKEGQEKALPIFNDPKGPFAYRDLYVVVLDAKSVVLANAARKELIGKNMWDAKDADGKLFSREMVLGAQANGKGWTEYKFLNPATGKVELKVAYYERVGDLTVLCGAYRQ